MGTLQDIQNAKYRSIMDLVKNEEPFDKKKSVMNGLEAFYLFHKRYEALQIVLEPLKNILGEDVIIISINFNNVMQEEKGMVIKYLIDGKLNIMVINMYELEILDVVLSNPQLDSDSFLETNREIISEVVRNLERIGCIDESEVLFKSSSKRFILGDNCNDFIIRGNEEKLYSIGTNHFSYDKNKGLYVPEKIICENPSLKEELMSEETIQKVYNHLRVYEDDFPKELIKKIM